MTDDILMRMACFNDGNALPSTVELINDMQDRIEALEKALRQCHTALEVAFDYDGDDVFGMMHNDAVDASMEAERLLGIK